MSLIYDKHALTAKGQVYCERNDTSISFELGHGAQGMVFKTERNSAIKVYNLTSGYFREVSVYRRLADRNIQSVQGFVIPRLFNWDDELFVFEMSVVHVPCIIDFGGAYLTWQEHVVRNDAWISEKSKEFGVNWERAHSIIRELEYKADICLSDVNSNNIKFPL